ncbi:hypothetical protein, conserved, partial [Eimeria acervulina]
EGLKGVGCPSGAADGHGVAAAVLQWVYTMEEVKALLGSWLEDSGHEVTATSLSLELRVPLLLAKK